MGELANLRENKRMWVSFTEYGVTVVASPLKQHMAQIHGICIPHTRGVDKGGGGPTTYVVSLPRVLNSVKFLVPVFLVVAYSAGQLQENFMYQHLWSQVTVVQDWAEPLTCCNL